MGDTNFGVHWGKAVVSVNFTERLRELAESIAGNSDAYTNAWYLSCIITNAMEKHGISDEHYDEIERIIDTIHDGELP